MQTIKTVGKSGQISIGKAHAGAGFILENLPGGDILLRRAVVVPINEHWLHEPTMKDRLEQANEWMRHNPPRESDLDALETEIVGVS